MDDLEFRRRLYANPHDTDPDILACIEQDTEKKALQHDLKHLDEKLDDALSVTTPEGLAERLVLNQSLDQFQQQKKHKRWHLAIAASIAFVCGVSFTLYQAPGPLNLEQHALAHVYHELPALEPTDTQYQLDTVNAKLASFGGQFSALPATISYATYCHFNGQKSMHLVLQTETGPMTVFIVPSSNQFATDSYFSDKRFNGSIHQMEKANIILLGDKNTDLEQQKARIKRSLKWQA